MFNQFVICMFISVTIASFSQILLKKSTYKEHSSAIKEYLNPYVIGGYALLMLSMVLTVYAYSGMDYKNGPIIEAFGNVIVLVLSFLFFKEKITLKKMLGVTLIIIGMFVFY